MVEKEDGRTLRATIKRNEKLKRRRKTKRAIRKQAQLERVRREMEWIAKHAQIGPQEAVVELPSSIPLVVNPEELGVNLT